MRELNTNNLCPVCGGRKTAGKTTYSVDLGFGVVVVRNVPATVCSQCGEEWIGAEIAGELERLVDEARQNRRQVEVVSL
jgi:YgiT-type zinc finger domain-containing protein